MSGINIAPLTFIYCFYIYEIWMHHFQISQTTIKLIIRILKIMKTSSLLRHKLVNFQRVPKYMLLADVWELYSKECAGLTTSIKKVYKIWTLNYWFLKQISTHPNAIYKMMTRINMYFRCTFSCISLPKLCTDMQHRVNYLYFTKHRHILKWSTPTTFHV